MSGCGCGGKVKRREMMRTAMNAPTRDGGYLLANYPNCTSLYRGSLEGDSVYVVGRNTEFERMFKRFDLPAASQYMIETKQDIENIPIVGLCGAAITDLFAAA